MTDGSVFRRWLLVILMVGIIGTGAELLLLEHWEGWQQWVPIALLGTAVPVLGWALASPGHAATASLRGLMSLFVISGLVGVWFHYSGNVEFEIEMTPDASGWSLFGEAMTGATPALAPSTMLWFGLLGLLADWTAPPRTT